MNTGQYEYLEDIDQHFAVTTKPQFLLHASN